MKESINIYICHTYYHVLISIIKQLNSKEPSDIVLAAEMENVLLVNDNHLITQLKESKIFNEIICFDYTKQLKIKKLYSIKELLFAKKIVRKKTYDFYKYKNIYIYNEHTLIGTLLNTLKIKYNLLEEGTDCFKTKKFSYNKPFKKRIKRFLKIYDRCDSPYINMIEVNDKNGIWPEHKNITVCNKKELFQSLKPKDKSIILKIFIKDTGQSLLLWD